MATSSQKSASPLLVIIAFATVYLVWGSTYFFIKMAVDGFPPFLLGAIRFFMAGALLLTWCAIKGERIFVKRNMIHAAVSGLLLLVIGNGIVIWVEQTLPSAMVAIMVTAPPIWFVLLDKPNWGTNFKSKSTIIGLVIGFGGVILLFSEQIESMMGPASGPPKLPWNAIINSRYIGLGIRITLFQTLQYPRVGSGKHRLANAVCRYCIYTAKLFRPGSSNA
jgi:drug/metabolite transporter (DMT)-like permease